MRKRGRAFIIGIGIMMAAAALSGCGKKAEETAVTTEAETETPEETKNDRPRDRADDGGGDGTGRSGGTQRSRRKDPELPDR